MLAFTDKLYGKEINQKVKGEKEISYENHGHSLQYN